MAAACYEKEVSVGAAHGHGHHGVASTPAPGQTVLPPAPTSSATGYKEYKEVATYKDYSQPLHVDCSVEYELPSQAKPPPGGGEPLLMIHPCYYRRAEQERRSPFVNNLPPPTTAPISTSRSRSRRSTAAAASTAVTLSSTAAAAAAASIVSTSQSSSSYHAALTAAATLSQQQLAALSQQQQQQQVPVPVSASLISADEKAVISGIYQHYFRAMRAHHQHQSASSSCSTSSATSSGVLQPTYHQQYGAGSVVTPSSSLHHAHHPYRRPVSRAPHLGQHASSIASSSVYASAMHRRHAASLHALQAAGFYEAPAYHALLPQS